LQIEYVLSRQFLEPFHSGRPCRLSRLLGLDRVILKMGDPRTMKRITVSTTVLACLLTALFAVDALAGELVFFSPVVGSNPGITIAGVARGGAPWVVRHGSAILTDGGRVRVDVRGLILPSTGNTGPVTQVAASVVCSDAVAATSKSVNLSAKGNAEISDRLTLPSPCFGPVVLIRVTGVNNTPLPAAGPWIASTGTIKDAKDNDVDDNGANNDQGQ
jgi:hypothetical protein